MGNPSQRFPGVFWRMCLGALLLFLSFNMVLPELPNHLRAIGGGRYIGWILSAFAFSALAARPLSGWITDNLGRKWSMLGGAAFCVIAGVLYPISQVIWFFFMVRALHGFSTGFAPSGLTAFTADVVPHNRRGEAMGWQGMFSNIGSAAGYILGAAIIAAAGVASLYYTSALLAILAIVIFASLPETKKEGRTKVHSLKDLFYKASWKPAVIMFCVCVPLGVVLTLMPDITLAKGFSNKGLFLSIYVTFSLMVRIFSGKLSDRIGRTKNSLIGGGLQSIAFLLLLVDAGNAGFFCAAACYGMGQGFNAPGLFAWADDTATAATRGRALGMLFMTLEAGIIFGSLASGELIHAFPNHYGAIFSFCLFWSLMAAVLSLIFKEDKHKHSAVDVPIEL
ncbi:MAG: MFS transporter [Bacteroidota bacterium]|jgi:MFS family permease